MWVAAEELGPVGYGPGWWVLAIGLLGAVLLWNLGVLLWGRSPRVAPARESRGVAPASRASYLARIDEIEADHQRGLLSARAATQALSALVRRYVEEQTGVPTTAMTLADLREHDVPGLVGLVELLYPPEFAREPVPSSPTAGVAHWAAEARTVVSASWS